MTKPQSSDRLLPVVVEFCLPKASTPNWEVTHVRGTEGISVPFEFVIDLRCEDVRVAHDELLGADAELVLDRNGLVRAFHGIITRVDTVVSAQIGIEREGLTLRAVVVPAFKLLDQQIDTRFFAGQTAIEALGDILRTELANYQRTIDCESFIKRSYLQRDYCVQFRESTFAFCNRIMEEEGIAHLFVSDEAARREKLVLIDNNDDYQDVELLISDTVPIVLNRAELLDRESLHAFEWRAARTPNCVITRGQNPKVPRPADEGRADRVDAHHPSVREVYRDAEGRQIIDDPVGDPDSRSFQGTGLRQRAREAEQLLDRYTLESTIGVGGGNAIGFAAGRTFKLGDHPDTRLDHQRFLIVQVRHECTMDAAGQSDTAMTYSNDFDCIPIEHVFRPTLRTPKPRAHGIQTGVVVGRAKDEIYTDPYGRIRVRFHRDRYSGNDENASCWIRVAQIWAGLGFGAMVIPRVGMEVVVSFIDGDPDQPIVTGCVYDGVNMPPYPLPTEMSKSTFRTSSSPGGDGFNELRFEDARGSEQIFVHAQRRMDVRVRGNLYATTGGNREEQIGWERDGTRGGDHNTLVHKDVNHHVEEVHYAKVDKQRYSTVVGNVVEDFQAKHMILVADTSQVSAPRIIAEASGLISQKADAVRVSGSSSIDIKGGGRVVIESNNAIELKVGGNFISITPAGIAIQGTMVRLNSGGGVGSAVEGEPAIAIELLEPLDALAADDGSLERRSGGGVGGARGRKSRTLDPHHAPPMRPPPPPSPGRPTVLPDGTLREFLTLEWVETETWCSELATLRGTTRGYVDCDTETAEVRDASDGSTQRAVTLSVSGDQFVRSMDVVNMLPRRPGANFEIERALDAVAVGRRTPKPIRLRFIPHLSQATYASDYARFDLVVQNYEVVFGGVIHYVLGSAGLIIQLGDVVPSEIGGDIGVSFTEGNGGADGAGWRYAKRDVNDRTLLLYWNGAEWKHVPVEWKNDKYSNRLLSNGIWEEGGAVRTQYGKIPWPDPVPAWTENDLDWLRVHLVDWKMQIEDMWTNKFDIKRRECRSTDPRCCRYHTRAEVHFVRQHVRGNGIIVCRNDENSNSGLWSTKDTTEMPCHEFGHLIGNLDEYEGSVIDPNIDSDGANAGIDHESIMGKKMKQVRRRHYTMICQQMAHMVDSQLEHSCTYEAVPLV